jgi:hypothetical protein
LRSVQAAQGRRLIRGVIRDIENAGLAVLRLRWIGHAEA